ncbi:toxin co-regulated pilus biosynthesis Q family protein [Arsenophonus apicola]|jgi:hypothetical protein|uniref:toxin co-regulated pilus biosynthesis Q family protein n=1 Tax=Arsenophonus apicola TaxID=2879119 RepID=UPI00387A4F78
MQLKPTLSWCVFLLAGCGNTPTLTQPKGAFFSVNPENVHLNSPAKKPEINHPSLTSQPLTVIQPPKIVSIKNTSSSTHENKTNIHSQVAKASTNTTTSLPAKPLTAMKVTPPQKPVQTWQIEKGRTLKEGVMIWAEKAPCIAPGVKNWTVFWQTSVDYQIAAPLHFSGDFKTAMREVLALYQSAKKPLFAETNTPQCLIIVKDGRF